MVARHYKEPRNVGFSKENEKYYKTDYDGCWISKDSNTIFSGKMQKDLFVFAAALGKYRGEKKEVKNKQSNAKVDAMTEYQKWTLLSIGISESNDLLQLEDESQLYALSEEYAEEGINILKSRMAYEGLNYPERLIEELLEILDESGILDDEE